MAARKSKEHKRAGDRVVWAIRDDGALSMTHLEDKSEVKVQTQYEGFAKPIYCVSCEREGKIYGGSGSSSHTFCYDTNTGKLEDLGRHVGGRIQVYDILSHSRGLFFASYTGAHIDLFDPGKPRGKGNPRNIAVLSREHMQERPVQLALGPDGMIYTGTVPVKGHLGGALTRIDPGDLSVKVWRNFVPNQSITNLAAVPETGELFCTSSIRGGSSAIPTEKEAFVLLWDTKQEKIVWRGQPQPGAASYGAVVRADNGLIYGLSGNGYYACDPQQRKVVFTGQAPVKRMRFPGLSDHPAGPEGLIYGIGDDAIFVIDPKDHSTRVVARHPSLNKTQGFYATNAGVVYYGAGDTLMRAVPQD